MPKPGSARVDLVLAFAGLLCAATWPVADLVLANAGDSGHLSLVSELAWAAGIALAAATLTAAIRPLTVLWTRAAAISAAIVVLFFSFAAAQPYLRRAASLIGLSHGVALAYLALLMVIAIALGIATRTAANRRLVSGLVIGMCLTTSVAAFAADHGAGKATPTGPRQLPSRLDAHPNVYAFLFDAMGRPDQLKASLGLGLDGVPGAFEQRGFAVARNAQAAFLATEPSIHSILNPSDPSLSESVDLAGSEVVRYFRSNGYRYRQYGEVFAFAACSGLEDVCLSTGRRGLMETDVVMLRRTPLYAFFQRAILASTTSRNMPLNLARVASAPVAGPTFTFTYMVPPHPPLIFSTECRADQQDFNDFRAWRAVSIPRYGVAYRCVTLNVLRAIDQIIARDPSAIIVVSGDHGTMFRQQGRPRYVGWTPEGLAERRPVFLAARLPARCASEFAGIQRLPETYPTLAKCLSSHF